VTQCTKKGMVTLKVFFAIAQKNRLIFRFPVLKLLASSGNCSGVATTTNQGEKRHE
jgi:hypothetical protein